LGNKININKDNVFVQAAALTAASFVLQILLFVYRIIITRFSGAGGMGVFQLAMPYYSILASVSLSGMTVAVSRLTVEKTAVGEEYKTDSVVQTALRLFVILLAACTAVTFLFPDLIAGQILGDIRTKASMLLLIPCLFLTGFENIYKAFFYGAKHIKPNIISEPTELIIRIISVFILLYLYKNNLTPERTAFLMVSAMIVSEIFSFIFLGAYYKIYQAKRAHHVGVDSISARKSNDGKFFNSQNKRRNLIVGTTALGRPPFNNKSPNNKFKHSRHNITDDRGRSSLHIKSKNILPEISRIAAPICASSVLMTIISSVNTILIPKRLVISGMTQTQAVETLGILMGMSMPAPVK